MNKIHLVRKEQPVEPEISKEAETAKRTEIAVRIVRKYLEGVSLIYDIDEKWLMEEVIRRLESKKYD